MSHFTQIFDKNGNLVPLSSVDEKLCNFLNVKQHPNYYGGGFVKNAFNWYDTIIFGLAICPVYDIDSPEFISHFQKLALYDKYYSKAPEIIKFLKENYIIRTSYKLN